MKERILFMLLALILALAMGGVTLAGPPVDGNPDHDSVSNYAINSATQTGASQVTVNVQANFCPACKPNQSTDYDGYGVGCASFTHGYPPPPPNYWCIGEGDYVTGRYVAVQLSDSGTVLGTTKMVCDPSNWPLVTNHQADVVVDTSIPMVAGTMVTVEADIFCGWCGHWYPETVEIEIEDVIPPEVSCVEAVNPHGQNIPGGKAQGKGKGNNPDGFYELIATDIGNPNPEIWVGTTCNSMLFGPFYSGDVIKFTEDSTAAPSCKPMGSAKGQAGAVVQHIILPSDPVIKAYDGTNWSTCATCLVPPPPK